MVILRDFVFYRMKAFINHVQQQGPKFTKIGALSHKSSRVDMIFAAPSPLEHQNLVSHIIAQGHKIIQLGVNNSIFRHLPVHAVRLANLAKTLCLDESLRKGYFPYLLNTPQYQIYQGLYPKLDFYDIGSDLKKEAQTIAEAHKDCVWSKKTIDFWHELLDYCRNGVLSSLWFTFDFQISLKLEQTGFNVFFIHPKFPPVLCRLFDHVILKKIQFHLFSHQASIMVLSKAVSNLYGFKTRY